MKTKNLLYAVLMLLPLLTVCAVLPFLENEVPVHFDMAGQADRFGSRFEMLVFPAVSLLSGGLFLLIGRSAAKQEGSGDSNSKILRTASVCVLALVNLLTVYFLVAAYRQVKDLSLLAWDANQAVCFGTGLFLIIVGNLMPKAKKNALLGLRTQWSMKNEDTWKKSQRFCGIASVIAGAAMTVLALVTRGTACLAGMLAVLLLHAAVSVWYSYQAARES